MSIASLLTMLAACATVDTPIGDGSEWIHPLKGRQATGVDLGNCTVDWLRSPAASETRQDASARQGLVWRLVAGKRLADARRTYVGACMMALGYRRGSHAGGGNGEADAPGAVARLSDEVEASTGTRLLLVELPVHGRNDWDIGLGFWCAGPSNVAAPLLAPGMWDRESSLVRMQFDGRQPEEQWFNANADLERAIEGAPPGTGGVFLRGGSELLARATRGHRLLVQVDDKPVLGFDLYAARDVLLEFYARCTEYGRADEGRWERVGA